MFRNEMSKQNEKETDKYDMLNLSPNKIFFIISCGIFQCSLFKAGVKVSAFQTD